MAKRPWPKLSETLDGPEHPERCRRCGSWADLVAWRECDEKDRPTPAVLMLCVCCSDAVIEDHPRLYHDIPRNAPEPGLMALCVDCRHRDGLTCSSPLLKRLGGPGLRVDFATPTTMFVDGTKGSRRCGWTTMRFPAPPSKCAGREVDRLDLARHREVAE